jgi:hypothetical protein
MKRYLIVIILFCIVSTISNGQLWKQKRYETLFSIGTTQFFGDIGGFTKGENILGLKDISFMQTRFNFTGGLKYKIVDNFNIRLNLAFGMFHATDDRGSNESRDMEAKTTFFEPTILAEYYFIKSKLGESYLFSSGRGSGKTGNFLSSLEFYAFSGFGGLSFNVKGNDNLVALGQPNSGFAAVIPLGLGANILFKPEFNLGLEIGGRYSFSDYLDGYTSQYSGSNDVYYFFNVTFTYKIKTNSKGVPSFLSKSKF